MAKELPYYKFNVAEFLLGRISSENKSVIADFILACAHYWHKECNVTVTEIERKLTKNVIKKLISLEYLIKNEDRIMIPFLDEQWIELSDNKNTNSKNGIEGAKKRWGKNDGGAIALRKEEDKDKEEDKIRKERERDGVVIYSKERFLIEVENSEWFKDQYRNLKIDPDAYCKLLDDFLTDLKPKNGFGRALGEIKIHSYNSIKIKIEKNVSAKSNKNDRQERISSINNLEDLAEKVLGGDQS